MHALGYSLVNVLMYSEYLPRNNVPYLFHPFHLFSPLQSNYVTIGQLTKAWVLARRHDILSRPTAVLLTRKY